MADQNAGKANQSGRDSARLHEQPARTKNGTAKSGKESSPVNSLLGEERKGHVRPCRLGSPRRWPDRWKTRSGTDTVMSPQKVEEEQQGDHAHTSYFSPVGNDHPGPDWCDRGSVIATPEEQARPSRGTRASGWRPAGRPAYGTLMGTPSAGDSWFRLRRARPKPSIEHDVEHERSWRGRSQDFEAGPRSGENRAVEDGDHGNASAVLHGDRGAEQR